MLPIGVLSDGPVNREHMTLGTERAFTGRSPYLIVICTLDFTLGTTSRIQRVMAHYHGLNCKACGDLLHVKTTRKGCTVRCGRCHFAKGLPDTKATSQEVAVAAWHKQTGHVCPLCSEPTVPDERCVNCLYDPASGERCYS